MNTGDLMDGRYRLRDRLGAGGMSVVWRAHDEVLERDVAVKVLSPDLADDPLLLDRVRSEARAAARLRHPNIVEVYDYAEAAGPAGRPLPYVVMELIEGRTLSQLLTAGPLPWRVAVLISAQVAAALAAAHERGVVHRDVKPGNVVVAGAGVKLVDFGISATSGENDRAAGQLLGTPAYLAPERLETGLVRPATDVYALGLLLYRTLAGQLPWRASTTTQMLAAHRYQEPAALPALADLPAEVADLCRRCLDKDPGRRPAAAEAAVLLGAAAGLAPAVLLLPDGDATGARSTTTATRTALLAGGTAAAVRAVASGPLAAPLRRWRRLPRRGRVVVGTGAAAVLLAGAAVAGTLSESPPGDRARAGVPAAVSGLGERQPSCTVRYTVGPAVDGRLSTTLSVANTGTVAVPAGRLTFTLPGDQRLVGGSPGTWRQDGRTVSAQIGTLPPGRTLTAAMRATYRGVNVLPDRFQLNETACQAVLSLQGGTTRPVPAPDGARRDGGDKKKDQGKDEKKKNEGRGDDEDDDGRGDD
ncbi:serine/threonine-protein kinase [Micromonospora sp. BQ11]|uniref:serine/threonine-protein kinase n=1 Tax=Micromonospora sp. BQ11 TaxID=3452212 RepID=UPI003F8A1940